MSRSIAPLIPRLALFGALWIVLAGIDAKSWGLAVAVVAAAAVASIRMVPPGRMRLRLTGVLRFLPFFLLQSIRAGVDVALRALRPAPDLRPGTIAFTTRLPEGPARTFFVAVVGLFPGTLTARAGSPELRIHTIDTSADPTPQLRVLETRVAELFGVERARLDEGGGRG